MTAAAAGALGIAAVVTYHLAPAALLLSLVPA